MDTTTGFASVGIVAVVVGVSSGAVGRLEVVSSDDEICPCVVDGAVVDGAVVDGPLLDGAVLAGPIVVGPYLGDVVQPDSSRAKHSPAINDMRPKVRRRLVISTVPSVRACFDVMAPQAPVS